MAHTGEREAEAMHRAVARAASARRVSAPNPWVGAVVLSAEGEVVGEGATAPPGGPHAEVVALAAAGERARGATAVVTLEPCTHHGRTAPCVHALAAAGVARVVVGLEDPDDRVAGRGVAALRAAGIEVEVGVGADAVRAQLAPYLHQRRTGRAYVVAKVAMSLDARTAAADGTSRWITGEAARADGHRLRAESQAVMVGAGTAIADRPRLTPRGVDGPLGPPPLRVLLDGRGRTPADGPTFDPAEAPTLVITSDAAPERAIDAWRAAGAKVEHVARDVSGVGVDLVAVLELLATHGVLQVLVEGGATLHGSLWRAGLVDELVAYVAPTVLGTRAQPAFVTGGPATLADAPRLRLVDVVPLGQDVRIRWGPG